MLASPTFLPDPAAPTLPALEKLPALKKLLRGAAELPRHPVWHCRDYYAAQARRFTGRRALDEAKRDLYVLLATSGADQW